MSILAAIRPDDWNLALFVHILGAMTLVGSLALVATSLAARDVRLGYRSLLIGVLPGWIVMRGAAEWIAEKEKVNDIDPTPAWVDIGYSVSDPMLLFIIIATVCAGLAARRQSTGGLRTAALVFVGLMLVASVIAIWAMTTKPT
jgi:hypothetical protein